MYKLITALFIATSAQLTTAVIPVGGLCANIAGPLSDSCRRGSICCYVASDLGLCTSGYSCPSSFLAPGELCSGIAGPSPTPCWPGYKCCNQSPDNSVCAEKC